MEGDLLINDVAEQNCTINVWERAWLKLGGQTIISCPGGYLKTFEYDVPRRAVLGPPHPISKYVATQIINSYFGNITGGPT